MLKDKLIEIIQTTPNCPGSFRQKDLIILFDECSNKFRTLVNLQEEVIVLSSKKSKLEEHKANIKIMVMPKPQPSDKERIKMAANDNAQKKKTSQYKIKCQIKSCGKIMYSQASFNAHMKKHAEKRNRKEESNEHIHF